MISGCKEQGQLADASKEVLGSEWAVVPMMMMMMMKWLSINKKVAYKKMLRCTNEDQLRNLRKYLDIIKCTWFKKSVSGTRKCKY
jgi:hypothetical protein